MSLNFNKGMKIDTNGNATFTGTINALTARIDALNTKIDNIFKSDISITGSLSVSQSLSIRGGLNVSGGTKIEGSLYATRLVSGSDKYIFNVLGGDSNLSGNRVLVYPDTDEPNKFINLFTTRGFGTTGASNCEGPRKYNC